MHSNIAATNIAATNICWSKMSIQIVARDKSCLPVDLIANSNIQTGIVANL
jgi:hypothetical protein